MRTRALAQPPSRKLMMDFSVALLYVFSGMAVAGGLGLVLCKHPIHGAISLLFSMLSLAGIYALLDAHLIAALQVIIYAGAIMILVVYIIMLLDLGSADAQTVYRKAGLMGLPLLALLLLLLGQGMISVAGDAAAPPLAQGPVVCPPGVACETDCGDGVDQDGDNMTDCADTDCAGVAICFGTVEAVGANLLGPFVLPFEIASVLLLAGIVGAILLTGRKPGELEPSVPPPAIQPGSIADASGSSEAQDTEGAV